MLTSTVLLALILRQRERGFVWSLRPRGAKAMKAFDRPINRTWARDVRADLSYAERML